MRSQTHCTNQAHDLEQSYKESVLKLEHKVLVEEGHDCQAFVGACGTALYTCPTEAHGALMYPLVLLTGNMPLATILATPHYWLQWAENHD